jgi:hypothetical protein
LTPLKCHIKTKNHLNNVELSKKQPRLSIKGALIAEDDNFHKELTQAFIKANIPINKIQNLEIVKFLEKYIVIAVKSESTYRKKIIKTIYEKEFHYLKMFFSDKEIYIIFDETTDSCGRFILNILLGECNLKNRMAPKLFKTIELETTNSSNCNLEILNVLNILYDFNTDKFSNVKLILSDAAPYAIKVGKWSK